MNFQGIVAAVAEWIPVRVKTALKGKRSSPSRFARVVHSILNRLSNDRYPILPCAGVLRGFKMRVDWRIHRGFAYGSWEPEVVETIQRVVGPGMTALDIGAQSGFYSLLLSRLVGPRGKVVAFEPLPANYRLLDENLAINGIQNVVARHEAVADFPGEMQFSFPHHEASLVAGPLLPGESTGTFPVPCTTLDQYAVESSDKIQFIKMDVEGAETAVLLGARNLLGALHPCMMIELHFSENQSGPHPALAIVEEMGYGIEWLGEVGATAHILARWKE
jgi:FkbM family methyltransferase